MDEFIILATKDNARRTWTRDSYNAAKSVADGAVSRLSYDKAVVTNIFGGDVSDPLYVVEATKQGVARRDYVAEDCDQERPFPLVTRKLKAEDLDDGWDDDDT